MVFVSDMPQPSPNPIQAPVYLSQSSTMAPNPTTAGPVVALSTNFDFEQTL